MSYFEEIEGAWPPFFKRFYLPKAITFLNLPNFKLKCQQCQDNKSKVVGKIVSVLASNKRGNFLGHPDPVVVEMFEFGPKFLQ